MNIKLETRQLGKTFRSNGNHHVVALEDVNFSLKSGEFVCIIGQTGCGKTTLLRMIAGLETPGSGKVLVEGRQVQGINQIASLVFQQFSLFPWYTVIQNIIFPLELKGLPKKQCIDRGQEILEMVGLSDFAESQPYELSGGMQQRVAIGRALAYDPEILLMDEPFGALDIKTRHHLQDLLLEIWQKRKKTILFVTHNIDEAISLANRVIVMAPDPGRILEDIPIDIPRPRNRLDDIFINYHLKLRQILELSE